jgi:excinuclease UvrABC nuclease subunit
MINPQTLILSELPSIPFVFCKSLPSETGIYFALSISGEVLYIGQTGNLAQRWHHHNKRSRLKLNNCDRIAWLIVGEISLLSQIESALIKWFDPPLNDTKINSTFSRGMKVSFVREFPAYLSRIFFGKRAIVSTI